MSKPFSEEAWERNLDIYEKTLKMPFNDELADGILSTERFRHYVLQDTKYLEEYAKAWAAAASRADSASQCAYFAGVAASIAQTEMNIHRPFFEEYKITDEEYESVEMSPACSHYTTFLHSLSHQGPLAVQMAALLPCGWVYAEIGKSIKSRSRPDNPYRVWIDGYGSPEFDATVRRMIVLTDDLAAKANQEQRERMHWAYRMAARLEWIFWDSAYRLETWPC